MVNGRSIMIVIFMYIFAVACGGFCGIAVGVGMFVFDIATKAVIPSGAVNGMVIGVIVLTAILVIPHKPIDIDEGKEGGR